MSPLSSSGAVISSRILAASSGPLSSCSPAPINSGYSTGHRASMSSSGIGIHSPHFGVAVVQTKLVSADSPLGPSYHLFIATALMVPMSVLSLG